MRKELTGAAFLKVEITDQKRIEAFAIGLAKICKTGDVLGLNGRLGIGKTTFARALINAIASASGYATELVPSPTYTLMQVYSFGSLEIYHADLYRLENSNEIWELGLEDSFHQGLTIIEWPDRMASLLPSNTLQIFISPGKLSENRVLELHGCSDWKARVMRGKTHG